MPTIINGSSPSITFSDNTTQTTAFTGSAATLSSGTLPAARLPAGSVLQVVQASSATGYSTTSSNFQATNHSVTITPISTSSRILLLHQGMVNSQASAIWCWASIFRNGSVNLYSGGAADSAGGVYVNGGSDNHVGLTLSVIDSPNTTSATTYTVYFKNNNNSSGIRYNADGWKLYMIAMEIAG